MSATLTQRHSDVAGDPDQGACEHLDAQALQGRGLGEDVPPRGVQPGLLHVLRDGELAEHGAERAEPSRGIFRAFARHAVWPGILVELHVNTCLMDKLFEAVVLEEI